MKTKVRKNPKEFNPVKASVVLMLAVGLNLFGFLSIGSTVAFYNDTESSTGNLLAAGSLDFLVNLEKQDTRFQTHTQGGWGSAAHGDNPGSYRDDNFASAFPDGATIGDAGGYTALFTDAEAVKDFLPAGGTPMPFNQNHIDPEDTEAGVLAGQTLALTLNVGFDLYDPDFAPSVDDLGDFRVNELSNICYGMTVQEVLDEANAVLGGLPSSFSPSDINDCATWINERFVHGGDDGLTPGTSMSEFATVLNGGSLGFQYTVHTEKTGGDDDFCNALDLEALLEGGTNYTGDLMTFISSPIAYSSSADEWEFIISLPLDAEVEGSCSFDFVFEGWQTSLPDFGGFSDIERVDDPIHSTASVTVHSDDAEEAEPDGGNDEPSIQEQSLDNEPKVEEAITGEQPDDEGGSDNDGDEPDVDTSTDETVTDEETEEVIEEVTEEAVVSEEPVVEEPVIEEDSVPDENVDDSEAKEEEPVEEPVVEEPEGDGDSPPVDAPADEPAITNEEEATN